MACECCSTDISFKDNFTCKTCNKVFCEKCFWVVSFCTCCQISRSITNINRLPECCYKRAKSIDPSVEMNPMIQKFRIDKLLLELRVLRDNETLLQDYKSLGTYEELAGAISHLENCEFANGL